MMPTRAILLASMPIARESPLLLWRSLCGIREVEETHTHTHTPIGECCALL